jgi:hypothetical protein
VLYFYPAALVTFFSIFDKITFLNTYKRNTEVL